MRIVRWTLLILYLWLVFGLFGLATAGSADNLDMALILLGVTLTADAVFILGAGSRDLFRPIRRRRLLLPVAAAAFMLAVLVGSLTIALVEVFRVKDEMTWTFWAFVAASWVFWGALLYIYTRRLERYDAIYRLARLVFAGSLAELLAAAPAHIIVSRRTGCFVGLNTAVGLVAGIGVMIWSFGPAIFLLFLQEARRRESRQRPDAVADAPTPKRPLQFQLRTLLLAMLATSVVSALMRTWWLHWPSAAIAAMVVLTLVVVLLTASRWLLIPALAGMLLGVAAACWGDWKFLAILAAPMALLAMVQLKVFFRR